MTIGVVLFGLLCSLALVWPLARLPIHYPIDVNEAWNALNAERAMDMDALYPSAKGAFFNNYPPLSFFVVAGVAHLTGDALVAGRIVSLVAFGALAVVLFCVARTMICSDVEAAFAATLFIAYTLTFSHYVGIDDPEPLAHVVQGAGLLAIVRRPRTLVALSAGAALLAAGVFVKHNAVALPLAAAVWLMLVDRPAARILVGGGALVGLGGLAACEAVFGRRFLLGVFAPRAYSLRVAEWCAVRWASRMPVFIGALVSAGRRAPGAENVLLCGLYACTATAVGLAMLGGAGVDWNVMFDSNWAFCLSSALALNRLWPEGHPARHRRRTGLAAAYVAVLAIAAIVAANRQWLTPAYWIAPRAAQADAARREIEFLRRADGPAACQDLALCYWAGKPAQIDFFNLQQRIVLGTRNAGEVLHLVDTQYFAAIQLAGMNPYFDARFPDLLLARYRVDHAGPYGIVLVPKAPSHLARNLLQ